MAKLIWIVPGAALGGAGAVLAAMAWPMLGLEDGIVAVTVFAVAVGLLLFYAVAFGAAAIVEAADVAIANGRLAQLVRDAHHGVPAEPALLYEALSGTWLGGFAVSYVASLRAAGKEQRYVGPDPAQSFPIAALIEDRLMAGLFCRFAEFFIALALISLLLGSAFIVAGGLGGPTVMPEIEAVLVATAAALGGAASVWLTQPGLLGLCHAQVRRFLLLVRSLYGVDDGADQVRRVAENVGELRRELGQVLARTETLLEREGQSIAKLAESHAKLLSQSFDRVVKELEGNLAGVVDKAFSAFTQALDREFGGVERHGALAAEARDAFRAAADKLETLSNRLAEQAASHATAASGTTERLLGGFEQGLDRLGESVFGQATGELRAAAATMRQLYESVDALCLSVAPVLNRLVDTQDALLASLPQEGRLPELMAEVTSDLKHISKAQRETVERQLQMTSELSRVTLNLGQSHASVAGNGNGNGVHRSRMTAAAHDVIAALRELRDEADEAGKEPSMPKVQVDG
jgi:hypothetical protein